MSGSSELPVAPLPLTSKHRDELDQAILKRISEILDLIPDPIHIGITMALKDWMCISIIMDIIYETIHVLKRENLKNVLRTDIDMKNQQTLQQHPQLRDMVRKACLTRSNFTHIADLKIFQISESGNGPTPPAQEEEDQPAFLTNRSNNEKFRGHGLERPYYAKFCSIVQSSGTGKSRLMTELQHKGVLVLYMNLREPSDSGFPKRDIVPARILTEDMGCSQAEYTARCCALFAAIFHTLEQNLSTKVSSDGPGVTIKSWNNQMCDMRSPARTKFFEKVQTRYHIMLDEIKMQKSQENVGAIVTLRQSTRPLRNSGAPKLEGASLVAAAYTDMLKTPHVFPQDDAPKLVIAFDEAHPLSNMSSKGFRPSHILGRTIKAYCHDNEASVWVVFASTTSQVADFSAPQVIHDSLRVAVDGQLLYQPYTYLGWDQNADSLSGGNHSWAKQSVTGIMKLAAQKLCKSKIFNPQDINEALAVLSQRFGLDICFGHPNSVSYLEKGVASHLRICFSTTEDRSWGIHRSMADALNVLKAKVDGGMVETGQCGELASRLLLLLAKDMYVRSNLSTGTISDLHYNGSEDAELIHCQKVSVVNFLEYLFGDEFWLKAGEKAKAAFQHAYINFSHWVSMENFISPKDSKLPNVDSSSARCDSKEWTLRHWHRTSAVQCCHLQPLVDKMIPIYFDDPALGSNDVDRVSQIFISDKAGKTSNERDLGFITRKHGSIQCLSELPCIALLLDLKMDSKLSVTFPKKKPKHSKTDRCLRIYASGITDTTFPFLRDHFNVAELLRGLVSRQEESPSQTTFKDLDALVKFGSTATLRHSRWEAQN
ncbi:hypothetical protein BD769DRAFT_1727130 [Suillus cothurnatus]|nr:hypothetical protein BD769DRAFT_1727130 [Suillus cothurnatus]